MKCPACDHIDEAPESFKYTPASIDKLPLFDEKEILCCGKCGFGMIEEDVDESVLQQYYSSDYSGKARKQAEVKVVDVRTRYSYDKRAASQLALIKQYVELNPESTVVEIGAGTGGFLFSLRQMGYKGRYLAFEPQEQAHDNLIDLGGEVVREVFTLEQGEQHREMADLVVMSHSLEHFNPGGIEQILKGVHLMLRKGGGFFCEVPNANLVLYPNAGERVVPHLSFFSINSLKSLIQKIGMEMLFINGCGDSQLEKDHKKQIEEYEKAGLFVFDLDSENGILRNRKYHRYLEDEGNRQRKKQRLLNLAMAVIGKRGAMWLFDIMRRFRQAPYYSLIGSSDFSYGSDREFIRLVALK